MLLTKSGFYFVLKDFSALLRPWMSKLNDFLNLIVVERLGRVFKNIFEELLLYPALWFRSWKKMLFYERFQGQISAVFQSFFLPEKRILNRFWPPAFLWLRFPTVISKKCVFKLQDLKLRQNSQNKKVMKNIISLIWFSALKLRFFVAVKFFLYLSRNAQNIFGQFLGPFSLLDAFFALAPDLKKSFI